MVSYYYVDYLSAASPVLLVLFFQLTILPSLCRTRDLHRTIVCVLTVLFALRYLAWRLIHTVLPFEGGILEEIWTWSVFVVELLAFFEASMFLLIMSRFNDRHLKSPDFHCAPQDCPSVDVLIPTYNEPLDVLEKTIIGARSIDYANFSVWVLDDGKRDWLKDFCRRKGVGYIRRNDNAHAKAGNINHALSRVQGEYFAIFDADFVPKRNFLKRTLGHFAHDEHLGIVQTPQHFFNKDPIQANLYLHREIPDEQRLFFDEMAPARDAWDAAFCCGSCSILRREAVDRAGGIPTQSITEDLLTTLVLKRHGYGTIYHNEKLSQGLAADSVKGYFIQRERWCRGGIQCMLVKEGPLRAPGLSLLQRVLFLPYGWVIQPITRIFVLLIPTVYLWTGSAPLKFTSGADIVEYLFPLVIMLGLSNFWLTGSRYLPIVSTAVGMFSAFRMFPVVISSLIKPFGEPFRVTPKGSGAELGIETGTLAVALAVFVVTVLGVIVNTRPETAILDDVEFFPYAVFWATLNLTYLVIVILLCFDGPRKRAEERFEIDEEVELQVRGEVLNMKLEDLSLGGAKFASCRAGSIQAGDHVRIDLEDVGLLEAEVLNARSFVAVRFHAMSSSQRDALITKLFTGGYENAVDRFQDVRQVGFGLIQRIFGATRT